VSSYSVNQTLITAQTSGSALSNSTTATSILPPLARFNLQSNVLAVGSKLRVKASGILSTAASSPGTLAFSFVIAGVTVFAGGASPTLTTSASGVTWDLDMDMTVRSAGAGTGTTILGTGKFTCPGGMTAPVQMLPASNPAAGTGFDSTGTVAALFCDLFATWSVASASNSITLTEYELIFAN
jgi:hypothetical protein